MTFPKSPEFDMPSLFSAEQPCGMCGLDESHHHVYRAPVPAPIEKDGIKWMKYTSENTKQRVVAANFVPQK